MIKVIVLYDLNVLWLPFLLLVGQAIGDGGAAAFWRSFIKRLLNTLGKVKAP